MSNDEKQKKREGRIDLHLHTTNSDGNNTPEEVLRLASCEGLKVIAFTDHNRFTFSEPFSYRNESSENRMHVIPGCEFSAEWNESEIHVIGIFPNGVNPKDFSEIFEDIYEGKKSYVAAILHQLREKGIYISQEDVTKKKRHGHYVGRHQIAEVMIEKGYAENMDDAFDRYIGNFCEDYLPSTNYIQFPSLEKIVRQIQASNGIPILAHPYGYSMAEHKIEALISDFKKAAGEIAAMEVFYEPYLKDDGRMMFLRHMAEKYDLLASVASDRHRDGQPFASTDGIELYEKIIQKISRKVNFHTDNTRMANQSRASMRSFQSYVG